MMMIETLPCSLSWVMSSRINEPSLTPIAASGSSSSRIFGVGDNERAPGARLPLATGQLGDRRVDVRDLHAHLVQPFLGLPAHGPAVQQRPADLLPVEEH